MSFKTTSILSATVVLLSVTGYGQTPSVPDKFVETNLPEAGSKDWYALNNSQNEFGVSIIDEKLYIKKVNERPKCELLLPSGKLIGINKGEWGGQLTFVPNNGQEKPFEIKSGNVKFIFAFKDKVYFIEGLAHLGYNAGALFELITTDNTFSFKKLIDFDDAPEAFTIYKDELLIATHQNFYIVKDLKKELILKDTFWRSLYPNSIVVFDEQNVFVGMRGGIAKIDLTKKNLQFYKNAE